MGINDNIWEIMGFLKDIKDENIESSIDFYDSLFEFVDDEYFFDLMNDTHLCAWWDSYLPKTKQEWESVGFDFEDEQDLIDLEDECLYDDDVAVNLIFDVAHNLLTKYSDLTVDDLIVVLTKVSLAPLSNTNEVDKYYTYNTLYENAKEIFIKQCETFYEINLHLNDIW